MPDANLLVAKDLLSQLHSSWKELNITSQITELNSLSKIGPTDERLGESDLKYAVEQRKIRLYYSLLIVMSEESEWSTTLNKVGGLVKTDPKSGFLAWWLGTDSSSLAGR